MKINPKEPLLGYEGEEWVETQMDGKVVPITLRHLIFMAVNTPIPQEPWNVDARVKCAEITLKVTGTDEADLADGEPTFILERADKLGNIVTPLAYLRLKQALFPETNPLAAVPAPAEEPA